MSRPEEKRENVRKRNLSQPTSLVRKSIQRKTKNGKVRSVLQHCSPEAKTRQTVKRGMIVKSAAINVRGKGVSRATNQKGAEKIYRKNKSEISMLSLMGKKPLRAFRMVEVFD